MCVMQLDLRLACSSSLRFTAMQFAFLCLVRLCIMLFLSMYVCLRCLLLPILFVENVDDVAYISPKQVELVSNEHWEKELN